MAMNFNATFNVNKFFNQIKGMVNDAKRISIEKTIAQCGKDIHYNLDLFRTLLHDPKIKTEAVNSKYMQNKMKSVRKKAMKTVSSFPNTYRGIKKENKDYFDTLNLALFKIDKLTGLCTKKSEKKTRIAVRVKNIVITLGNLTGKVKAAPRKAKK